MSIVTHGMGPSPALVTSGLGPFTIIAPDVPTGGAFLVDPAPFQFEPTGGQYRFALPAEASGFIVEVVNMAGEKFEVEGGVVRFEVGANKVRFVVPPRPTKTEDKPK